MVKRKNRSGQKLDRVKVCFVVDTVEALKSVEGVRDGDQVMVRGAGLYGCSLDQVRRNSSSAPHLPTPHTAVDPPTIRRFDG